MKRQLSTHAAAAKMIRAELKKNGINASVKSDSYSGGSSIRIRVTDQLPATVEEIKQYAGQFKYGHFDGMTDCYEYSNRRDDIPQVQFVFVDAEYSDEVQQAAWDYLRGWLSGYEDHAEDYIEAQKWDYDVSQQVWRVLNGSQGSFWTSRKPRIILRAA